MNILDLELNSISLRPSLIMLNIKIQTHPLSRNINPYPLLEHLAYYVAGFLARC